jgi:hypothetical protein
MIGGIELEYVEMFRDANFSTWVVRARRFHGALARLSSGGPATDPTVVFTFSVIQPRKQPLCSRHFSGGPGTAPCSHIGNVKTGALELIGYGFDILAL